MCSSGSIDKNSRRFHLAECFAVNQVVHLRRIGEVERDEIGFPEERIHVGIMRFVLLLDSLRQLVAVIIDDAHSGRNGSSGYSLTDAPHTYDSQRFAKKRIA